MKPLARRFLERLESNKISQSSNIEMLKKIKSKLNPDEIKEVYSDNGELINSQTKFLDIETDNQGEPVGFVMLEDCNDDKAACLNTVIAVTPEGRGKGLAQMMFRKAARFFVNSRYEQLIWRVRKTNTPSVKLAKKFGFTYGWEAQDDNNYDIYLVTNPSRFRF